MKKRNSGGEGGGANWMDTYGDMVTLLLCFFVLLYSMSTVDENKWKALVQSFNPNATPTETEIEAGDEHGPFADPNEDNAGTTDPAEADKEAKQEEIDQAMEMLYQTLMQYKEESGINVEITKGDGGVFLSLRDTVFFDGEEATLLPAGQKILTDLAPILNKAAPYIDQIKVLGHTAQANNWANDIDWDWELSSRRASVVVAELHHLFADMEDGALDPGCLTVEAHGQHWPVAGNDTAEGMAQNRRVEMVIMGKDLMNQLGGALEQYETMTTEGPAKASSTQASPAPESGGKESGTSGSESGSSGSSQEG